MERLAIVPFANLSSDADLNWAGLAMATAVGYDLASSRTVHAEVVNSTSDAYRVSASRILEGYFFERNGQMEVVATLEDVGQVRTAGSFELRGALQQGALPLANQLAKRLSAEARSFGTADARAFRAYGEALYSADRDGMLRGLESATAADPRFAEGYLAQARFLLASGNRAEALKALAAGKAANPDAIDAAEIEDLAASASGNQSGRIRAVEALTRLTPANGGRFKQLAELQQAERKFSDSVKSYESAARLIPEDAQLWNELGYAYAYVQDAANARRALEHYQSMLAPEETNGLDSLGEVSFYLGDFDRAGKYFLQAQEKNPARGREELLKAAEARLMNGDLGGADALFQKYAGATGQEAKNYEEAQWEFLTGRRQAGMARLGQLIATLGKDQQAQAMCQFALWKLETGAPQAAAQLAEQAQALAESPRARSLSAMCRAILAAQGGSGTPAERAFALLFARKFAEAAPLLEGLYRETNPAVDGQIRSLLAWTYVETGRIGDARPLVALWPIPLSSGDAVFAALVFPRMLFVRGTVFENEGKRADAQRCYQLYLKYAGDVPDIFGDQAKARRGLGSAG